MLLSGKEIGDRLLAHYASRVRELDRPPGLGVILVGDNPASRTYVTMKERACQKVGIRSPLFEMDHSITQAALIAKIKQLNADPAIDGILVQLPLPPHIDSREVIAAIDPAKDIDGFHPINLGKLLQGDKSGFVP